MIIGDTPGLERETTMIVCSEAIGFWVFEISEFEPNPDRLIDQKSRPELKIRDSRAKEKTLVVEKR